MFPGEGVMVLIVHIVSGDGWIQGCLAWVLGVDGKTAWLKVSGKQPAGGSTGRNTQLAEHSGSTWWTFQVWHRGSCRYAIRAATAVAAAAATVAAAAATAAAAAAPAAAAMAR